MRPPPMRWIALLLGVGLCLAPVPRVAPAASETGEPHTVQPERPTIATHAHTVAPGWVEVESGLERDHFADASRGLTGSLVAKVGLARRLQLNVSPVWQQVTARGTSSSGPGDLAVGVKWRLVDRAPLVGYFAILPALKFATGSVASGTGTGTTDASLLLISSHDLGPVSLDVNAGYTRRSGDGSAVPREATLWTVSSGFPLVGPLAGVLEIYGFPGTTGPSGTPPLVAVLTGPTLTPRPWLEFDAGLIVPVTGPQPHALYCGLVWNIGRF